MLISTDTLGLGPLASYCKAAVKNLGAFIDSFLKLDLQIKSVHF